MTMILREYNPSDCEQIAELFYQTVHAVNARDYTKEQLDVWATGEVDLAKWDRLFQKHYTLVALIDTQLVGFGDIDETGYLDKLYVHKDHQGEGIATAICDKLEQSVHAETLVTHASITAKGFVEHRGYHIGREQKVIRGGIPLTNYVMQKPRS